MLTHEATRETLTTIGITVADLLGSGSESWVYALDDARILRLYNGDVSRSAYVGRLKAFYNALPAFTFVCPVIHETGRVGSVVYAIEQRIPGLAMGVVLPNLPATARTRAFIGYLQALTELRRVTYPTRPYGELLTEHPVQAPTWSAFLEASMTARLEEHRARLDADVQNLDTAIAIAFERVATIPEPPKALVHGDYYPNNVLLGDDLRVSGILDFSAMTVVGDPFMDVAGGLLFLEGSPSYQPTDRELLGGLIRREYGAAVMDRIDTYRLYYSLYFAGAWNDDPNLYRWCVNNLNQAIADQRT